MLRAGESVYGAEVFVADADALLLDACGVLAGTPSKLLGAIDLSVARAVMSRRAFWELGWMSAKCARFHNVSDTDLRELLEREYLPRIPVVVLPGLGSGQWVPDASDVPDPDDVEHVQVARLISARMIYSHDRDLRRPGFAPATWADYDARIGHLSILVAHRPAEWGVNAVATLTGSGTSTLVTHASARLQLKPAVVWTALAVTLAGSVYLVLAAPQRRQRIIERLAPWMERLGAALERGTQARHALNSTGLIAPDEPVGLEAMLGAYLVRHPDSNMGEVAEALNLNAYGCQQLSSTLHAHPAFQRSSRYGWAVGAAHERLETLPSTQWVE